MMFTNGNRRFKIASIRARLRARAGEFVRLVGHRRARSELITRLIQSRAIHQDTSFTRLNRYPVLFSSARELLGDSAGLRILSFGCASGEEVTTLRKYFPRAFIVGAEINRRLLDQCRDLPTDDKIRFIHSSPAEIATHGPYDAVFCMAVLTRRPHEVESRAMADIVRHYPFERFASQLADLVAEMSEGGILVVEHALYRVEDVARALSLQPVLSHGYGTGKGPRFDRSGSLIAPAPASARIWRKSTTAKV